MNLRASCCIRVSVLYVDNYAPRVSSRNIGTDSKLWASSYEFIRGFPWTAIDLSVFTENRGDRDGLLVFVSHVVQVPIPAVGMARSPVCSGTSCTALYGTAKY